MESPRKKDASCDNCCTPWCTFILIPRFICIALVAIQAAMFDYYLIAYYNAFWFLFIFGDALVIGFFIFILVITYLHKHTQKGSSYIHDNTRVEIPYAVEAFFLYVALLITKTGICFRTVSSAYVSSPSTAPTFGLNGMLVSAALEAPIYLFFVKSAALTKNSAANSVKQRFALHTMVDILDGLSLVSIIFQTSLRSSIETVGNGALCDAIVAFVCMSFALPCLLLLVLTHGGSPSTSAFMMSTRTGNSLRVAYLVVSVLLVQLPFFALRIVVWGSLYSVPVSAFFLVKELLISYDQLIELVQRVYRQTNLRAVLPESSVQ